MYRCQGSLWIDHKLNGNIMLCMEGRYWKDIPVLYTVPQIDPLLCGGNKHADESWQTDCIIVSLYVGLN